MHSCCAKSFEPVPSRTGTLTVALAGNPNSGKTTIFNAITGLRQKVGNYPGVTVEKKVGRCKLPNGQWADVVDLPGTYSLISRSPDELVAMEVLRGLRPETPLPDAVVVVVDASNLQRNLYLVSQLIELGRPMVIALNMMDIAERRGVHVSPEALEKEIGVPVVPVVGHKREGIEELKQAMTRARVAPMPDWPLPQEMKEELALVGGGLAILDSRDDPVTERIAKAQTPLDCPDGRMADRRSRWTDPNRPSMELDRLALDRYQAVAERLLVGDRAEDLMHFARHEPVASLLHSATGRMNALGIDPMQADIVAHYRWIEGVAETCTLSIDELAAMGNAAPAILAREAGRTASKRPWSDRIDGVLIHKLWGLIIFALIMGALFVTIFWAAKPVMHVLSDGIKWLGDITTTRLPDGPVKALLNDGIFAGVGAVIVFVPQIALLFLFLAVLEDSGYLARAAFLMDRLLSKVGLHGKSFIPLLSSFACAIPGIMATRTIEDRKDRLATILIAPFMSCSARLPVYTLLIGAFFATYGALGQAGIMLGLYATGMIAAALIAWLFKRTLLRGPTPAFILEMPTYKWPQASQVLRQVWTNTREFLTKAGTTIFCMSVVLWALTYYPRLPAHEAAQYSDSKAMAAARLDYSIAGRMGHAMEPVMHPLGYDWKIGVGLVGAFAAREVFVSTMGIIYSVGDDGSMADVSSAMRADRLPSGQPVWTTPVALSLLVWFVLAMQCMSTLAIVRRETHGWTWPVFMLLYMNVLAYGVSFVVYHAARYLIHA